MKMFDFLETVRSPEHRLAWLVAIAADAIQIGALPLFSSWDGIGLSCLRSLQNSSLVLIYSQLGLRRFST